MGGGLIGVAGSSDQSNEIIEILGPTNPKIFDIQYSIILAVTGNYAGHYHTRSVSLPGGTVSSVLEDASQFEIDAASRR